MHGASAAYNTTTGDFGFILVVVVADLTAPRRLWPHVIPITHALEVGGELGDDDGIQDLIAYYAKRSIAKALVGARRSTIVFFFVLANTAECHLVIPKTDGLIGWWVSVDKHASCKETILLRSVRNWNRDCFLADKLIYAQNMKLGYILHVTPDYKITSSTYFIANFTVDVHHHQDLYLLHYRLSRCLLQSPMALTQQLANL
jgi:hypothetical protein